MIGKALAIDGWMTEAELLWLAEQAKTHSVIVEIGSYIGRSTRALGDNTSGVVYAVDNFYGPLDIVYDTEERYLIYPLFKKHLKDLLDAGRVVPIVADHSKVELDVVPDMVFIDGDHRYENVKADILKWREKLSPGGLLCGHDGGEAGVSEAVIEITGNLHIVEGTSIWLYPIQTQVQ